MCFPPPQVKSMVKKYGPELGDVYTARKVDWVANKDPKEKDT